MTDFADSVSHALGAVSSCEPAGGGTINRGWRIELPTGSTLFAKSRAGAKAEEFADEAAGLDWIREADALPVPEVVALIEDDLEPGLVLEWVEPGPPGDQSDLGRGLALLHLAGAEHFDQRGPGTAEGPIRFGEAVVPLGAAGSGDGFAGTYAARLRDLANQAFDQGSLGSSDRDLIEKVADRATEMAGPVEPPARVHGDLWSGNVIWHEGTPWLIDPAAHGGHREIDLAMLELFGAPDERFYSAYEDVHPLAEGFRERIGFWQLQPLLVHAVLLGGGYGRGAAVTARTCLDRIG